MTANLYFLSTHDVDSLEALRPGQIAREPRAKALLLASVSKLDNSECAPCLVTNLSASGARIKISESIPLSGPFKVSVPQRNLTRMARQVWRKGDQLGVVFLHEEGAKDTALDSVKDARIRSLEAEVAALKSEIGILKYQLYQREQ